jgi:hypothetical protein
MGSSVDVRFQNTLAQSHQVPGISAISAAPRMAGQRADADGSFWLRRRTPALGDTAGCSQILRLANWRIIPLSAAVHWYLCADISERGLLCLSESACRERRRMPHVLYTFLVPRHLDIDMR